jgi:hypothetical protein
MTTEELDAHLWSIGIGSDARKLRVLVCGAGPTIDAVEERLKTFGAEVVSLGEFDAGCEDSSADFAIIAMPCAGDYMDSGALALKPEGRYLVIIEPLACEKSDYEPDAVTLEMTSVEQVGGQCVRVTGYRPRREGE